MEWGDRMKMLTAPILELESYRSLLLAIEMERTPVFAEGVIDEQKAHMLFSLHAHTQRPLLVLTYSELRARQILDDLSFFAKDVMIYPSKDILFYSADVHSMETNRQRFMVLERLLHGKLPIVVASIESMLDRYPKKEIFNQSILTMHVGDVVEVNQLIKQLVSMGYERCELVESPGQFALRGGILDVFSLTAEEAMRIELWDDEIDSIRSMDVANQRSVEKQDEAVVFPMRELVYDEGIVEQAVERLQAEYEQALKRTEKNGLIETSKHLREQIGEDIARLAEDKTLPALGTYISYFYEETVSFLDYLPENALICYDEPQRLREHMYTVMYEYDESVKSRIEKGYLLPGQATFLFRYEDILEQAKDHHQVLLAGLSNRATDFNVKTEVSFTVRSMPSFQKRVDLFCEELLSLHKNKYRTLILAGTGTRGQRMAKELQEMNVPAVYVEDVNQEIPKGAIWIIRGSLSKGFLYEQIGLAVFSDNQVFGASEKKKHKRKSKNAMSIESFSDLHVGDYVVHDNHGIGVFHGLEKISMDGVQKDYMKISYRDGGSLFVPVNQMDMVQKYIGSGTATPRLNKLGGQDWAKAKLKARTAVKILAEDLIALYAKRAAVTGYVYGKDTVWQKEFEEAFPFEETDDQLNAIDDVKHDMEKGKVMDRLICGDVGYGKTEVAIRAAFKAVQEGKQVAFLVPTTILAQQHYNTFLQRMAGYPVTIGLLSRFRTPKQQKETLQSLEKGFCDIVIGTHRILSKDVKFKDLGLIIVDEEQRFGVGHKEKMKRLTENLNVLTLSATPIPRTLHMSLSGIRDMSILEEPPLERHPIQTYVMESNPEFVREAIHREIARGGQVYYLHNRVDSIHAEVTRLRELVPEANIAYAHGQMSERELENIMEDFINGETNVLVCTTIIETGMDIANANTIIIQDADRMGLAQLYQLRGRVGRSNRIAYAYLMYKRDKMLREVAEKRLQTIREFTEFGSGFKIAMRDLEIRGAGNLLGGEQHGHMESVGYDMYCRLLEEEIQEHRGDEKAPKKTETAIDLNISAFIPEFYIKNQEQRMEIYKKIAALSGMEEYYDMQEELEDRYGDLPKNVQLLLEVVLIKADASALGITGITQKRENILFEFSENASIDPLKLTKAITQSKGQYLFTAGMKPYVTMKIMTDKDAKILEDIKNFLIKLKE